MNRWNESQYLANESADAKQAVQKAVDDLKSSLGQAADPRLWTKEHPWAAMGVSLVAGFAAAAALTPRQDESLGERAAKVASVLKSSSRSRGAGRVRDTDEDAEPTGFAAGLLWQLFDLAKVAVGNAIVNQFRTGMAAYSQPPPEAPAAEAAASATETAA